MVHHAGEFVDLEEQMTTWLLSSGDSPDRMDALVYACKYLFLDTQGSFVVDDSVRWAS